MISRMPIQKLEENEIWKAIPGWEEHYEASSEGNVRSLSPEGNNRWKNTPYPRKLSPATTQGYRRVQLCRNGKASVHKIASLVLMTFRGPRPINYEGAHLNGQSTDDRLTNLIWATHKENMEHTIIHNTTNRLRIRGEQNGRSILTSEQVLEIKKLLKRKPRKHGTLLAIAKKFGVDNTTIWRIDRGKIWSWLA